MTGWVALLRGINVGGRNSVPMAGLRDLFEQHGCGSVSSYIQSGNVLFTHEATARAALARQLADAVAGTFGVASPVVLRTTVEIVRVSASHPFGEDTSRTHVAFLDREPDDPGALEPKDIAPDRFELTGAELYLLYPNGVHGSRLTGALIERRLGVTATLRNWRTVTRLAELAESLG
jgi:uncharacterized protein (DUF1697 family)